MSQAASDPNQASAATEPALHRPTIDSILEMADGDVEFLRRLFGTFTGSLADELAPLLAAVAGDDGEVIRRAAHRLRGSCAVIGARTLADALAAVELAGREGRLEAAREHAVGVAALVPRVQAAVAELLAAADASP